METKCNRILVGLDGSVDGLRAFDKAVELAVLNKADLVIAHIIDLRSFSTAAALAPAWAEAHKEGIQNYLADFAQEAKDAGVQNVRTISEMGAPKVYMATKLPEEESIDLVTIGAVGMTRLERLMVGSVAEYVTAHCPCDVYIVH